MAAEEHTLKKDSIDNLFPTDEPAVEFLTVKPEIIIPEDSYNDEVPDYLHHLHESPSNENPVKVESLTVPEMHLEINARKQQIIEMNKELAILENRIIDDSMDPINTQDMSANLLQNTDENDIFGTSENPVTISSDDESLVPDEQLDEDSASLTGDRRYFIDMTDAKPSNMIMSLNDFPDSPAFASSPSLSHPTIALTKMHQVKIDRTKVLFETAFSKDINNKSVDVNELPEVSLVSRTGSVKRKFISSDTSDSDSSPENDPFQKQFEKSLTPKHKPQQKTILTKTKNVDGSYNSSAYVSLMLPTQDTLLQDSGFLSDQVDDTPVKEKMVGEEGKGKGKGKGKSSKKVTFADDQATAAQHQQQIVEASANIAALNTQNIVSAIMLSHNHSQSLVSRNLSSGNTPQLSVLADAVNSKLRQIKNPMTADRKRATLKAALTDLFVDDETEGLSSGDSGLGLVNNLFVNPTQSSSGSSAADPPGNRETPRPVRNPPPPPAQDDSDEELKRYQFDSIYTDLCVLKDDLLDFDRVSLGMRGLVSESVVSNSDFAKLKMWEIPGLVYDFGDGVALKDAVAMMTDEKLRKGEPLPQVAFTLYEVNQFLELKNKRDSDERANHGMIQKINKELGQDFYKHYQWMDLSSRIMAPKDLHLFYVRNRAEIVEANMAPWPTTIMPRDKSCVKYQSVFKDGVKYVARTLCLRQPGIEFYTEASQMYKCVICDDLISNPYHVFVYCYKYKPNYSFERLMNWRETWLKACFIHWKISGVTMPSRNVFADARSNGAGAGGVGGGGRGRGAWRGSGIRRRGTAVRSLYRN